MRDQPTSWFAGTYDDLCEEDEEYYRRARERAIKIKELRKSYSTLEARIFMPLDHAPIQSDRIRQLLSLLHGKPIRKIYLGKDLLWERGRPIST